MMHHKGNEHSQGHRNTDRLTPLQALAIADTGGQGHRRATGSLSYRGLQKNYFNILIGKYFNRKIFFTGTHRQEDRTPTQATGSPLLARSPSRSMMMHRKGNEHSQEDRTPTQATGSPLLARSPSRSMMMHRKGNEHSQEHRDTDRLAPLQALTITDRTQEGDRPHHWRPLTQGDRLAPVGSRSLSVYDDTPQRK